MPRVVRLGAGSPHHHDLYVRPQQQCGDLAAEGRMPEHDRARDPRPEVFRAQQLAVGRHQVRPEARPARDLGDQRRTELARGLLRLGAGAGAGDDDGLGRLPQHGSHGVSRRPRVRLERGELADRARERLAEGEVELHRPRRRRVPGRRGVRLVRELRGQCRVEAAHVRHLHVAQPADRRIEQAHLVRGLVGTDPAQLGGPIGREQDERHPRVVRLQTRRGAGSPRRVPEVVTSSTGVPVSSARPRARNPADRSSMRTLRRSRPACS